LVLAAKVIVYVPVVAPAPNACTETTNATVADTGKSYEMGFDVAVKSISNGYKVATPRVSDSMVS
jgi:hypothetical protein